MAAFKSLAGFYSGRVLITRPGPRQARPGRWRSVCTDLVLISSGGFSALGQASLRAPLCLQRAPAPPPPRHATPPAHRTLRLTFQTDGGAVCLAGGTGGRPAPGTRLATNERRAAKRDSGRVRDGGTWQCVRGSSASRAALRGAFSPGRAAGEEIRARRPICAVAVTLSVSSSAGSSSGRAGRAIRTGTGAMAPSISIGRPATPRAPLALPPAAAALSPAAG